MINPSQGPNAGVSRIAEQSTPASVGSVSPKRSILETSETHPAQDTAVVSSFSQEMDAFMGALKQTPDVRPDVVAQTRRLLSEKKISYPPLDIIAGIGKLIGNDLQQVKDEQN